MLRRLWGVQRSRDAIPDDELNEQVKRRLVLPAFGVVMAPEVHRHWHQRREGGG